MANTILTTKIALVNKTTAEWATETAVPIKGCPCVEFTSDGKARLKIGDGVKAFSDLPYESLSEIEIKALIQDAAYDDTELTERVTTVENSITALNGNENVDGSVAKTVAEAKGELQEEIGALADLNTTAKTDLVSAVNEVRNAVSAGGTSAAITVDTSVTTAGAAKSYTLKQGANTVAVIDIPKDMVVSSGIVEVNPEGQDAGTYLVLTLANATSDKVYINVGTLVDIYIAQASATQVQLTINPSTREINATIVAGSITATELATDAVTTVKIADGNVTKVKLATDVQASLGKADTAIQSVTAGTVNGTVAVDGTDIAVTGLDSMAYESKTDYVNISDTLILNCTL